MKRSDCKLTVTERFNDLVMPEPNTGCWIWTGSLSGGYGVLWTDGRMKRASHISYESHKGAVPVDLIVCHHCDNRCCVNPDHLFLGTHKDNAIDKIKKNRHRPCRGEKNPNSKLNNQIVLEIVRLKSTGLGEVRIGRMLGVSRWGVSKVMHGRSWTHISGIKPNKKASELDKNN